MQLKRTIRSVCNMTSTAAIIMLGMIACGRHPSASHPTGKSNTLASSSALGVIPSTPSATPTSVAASPLSSEQWIVTDNGRYIPALDNFEQHFLGATDANGRGDKVMTAIELRSAANSLLPDTTGTVELVNPALVSAKVALERLALQAESSKVEPSAMMKAFAAAYDADLQSGMPGLRTEAWLAACDKPTSHLSLARDSVQKDANAAATELRKAKAYIDVDTARSIGAFRNLLAAEATKLSNLATRVAANNSDSKTEVDRVSTESARILAEFALHNARAAWQSHDSSVTARWLTAAIDDLKQCIDWAGNGTDSQMMSSLDRARTFAVNAGTSSRVDAAEMSKQLDSTGLEMKKLLATAKPIDGESETVANLTQHSSRVRVRSTR